MRIIFDPAKDVANRAKHGLSLAVAEKMDLRTAVIRPDDRREYGEARLRAYGMIDGRMHMMAFTFRDGHLRVISLRKANGKESRRYG